MFQHTAARRRLLEDIAIGFSGGWVSTHSRAEAAASFSLLLWFLIDVSTHSRAEAAALIEENAMNTVKVSTHSRAEAAALLILNRRICPICFNTQPRGGGCGAPRIACTFRQSFNTQPRGGGCFTKFNQIRSSGCFNTQPRGGGCSLHKKVRKISELNTVFR